MLIMLLLLLLLLLMMHMLVRWFGIVIMSEPEFNVICILTPIHPSLWLIVIDHIQRERCPCSTFFRMAVLCIRSGIGHGSHESVTGLDFRISQRNTPDADGMRGCRVSACAHCGIPHYTCFADATNGHDANLNVRALSVHSVRRYRYEMNRNDGATDITNFLPKEWRDL
eukprot:TRINITY_DN14004_c0_g1_i1.p1 TRINITY_DN14004_c0_g1~~TRINITY_DN14004_c0_g1_i1.p1  ORF type:complete len:169 (+),score=9.84 TRINITY_DN14004_c0_g1_i1:51-557(+)